MNCLSKRIPLLCLSVLCMLCSSRAALGQLSITMHLGNGYSNQYSYESPTNAIQNQPMSGNVQVSGLNGNGQIMCYVTNYGEIFSQNVSGSAYLTFTWTPSYLGATAAGCSVSAQGQNYQYVQTENMPMTVFNAQPLVIDPNYKVLSVVYMAPGNSSSSGYSNTKTNGSTTSETKNFTQAASSTLSFGFIGASLSATFGEGDTNGSTNASTTSIANAAAVTNVSNKSNPNALNHNEDMFVLWLNPELTLQQSSSSVVGYSFGLPSSSNGEMDTVEVTAATLEPNAQGVTTVPLAILEPIAYGSTTLPGLSHICAHPLPVAQCTLANQCGCVPSDFSQILAQDPLLNYTSTESPLLADVSGEAACSDLATLPTNDDCRYVPVPLANKSTSQLFLTLAGYECPSCNQSSNTYTVTDSTQASTTYTGTTSTTVGYSVKVGLGVGPSLANSQTWTWSDSESSGTLNGISNTMNATLLSSTLGCYQEVAVYEDTVYHTFVYQQPAGNLSCP